MAKGDSTTEQNITEILNTLNLNLQNTDAPIAFGGDVNQLDGEAIEAAFDFSDTVVDEAFMFGNEALDAAVDVAGDSFRFAGNAQKETARITRDAIGGTFDFAGDALAENRKVQSSALGLIGDVFGGFVDALSGANKTLAETNVRSLAAVDSATRSDTAQTLQELIRFVAGGAAVVGVAYFLASGLGKQ